MASHSIAVGSQVWAEHPEVAWIDGEVLEVDEDDIKISCSSGETVTVKVSSVYPKDPDAPSCGVDDMTKLAYLHEPGVLQNLKSRYDVNQIYTYTGSILIAVNPFRRLPHLYDPQLMEKYKGIPLGDLDPHPFAVADAAYRCNVKALEDSLCKRIMVTRDENITKSLDPEAAVLSRDALAKTVYSRLFDWLVNKINNSIGQDPDSKQLIGVLDIYGFESFKTNSFEQFCINLTNEKLQQHFNQHVFKLEQEEYTKEEIDWSYIEFVDNQDILDLIEKKPGGIIALLDEACVLPRSTHDTFAQKLYQMFKENKRFSKPKLARSDFTICHYAGDVTYQTELFLDKNKDYVIAEHQSLLNASKCSFISSLFPALSDDSSKSSKFSSIGSRFKQQLQSLLETLSATEPHYIRCVKPNNLLKPYIFENTNVLQQLRCGGVMEAIRISCAGYPTRRTFDEFIERFGVLLPNSLKGSSDEVTLSKKLLEAAELEGYQVGKTKVFLRAGQMAELDARRNSLLGRSASIIQRKVRSYYARKSFLTLQKSAIGIQSVCRGQLARQLYENTRRETASLRIQTYFRMQFQKQAYKSLYSSSIVIQAGLRGMAARKQLDFRRQTVAMTIIQSHCRRYLAQLHYSRIRKAAITTQCAWRRRLARKELRKLKMAAKETGALQAAKTMLEKQVEELASHLELEKSMRADMEEENAKLQSALQEMQLQFEETKDLLIKERDVAREAAEELAAENEKLKLPVDPIIKEDLVSSLEKKTEESEQLTYENEKLKPVDHIITEVPVVDTASMDKLTTENEQLKELVSSLEKKIDETEKRLEETTEVSEKRLKKALEAESKINDLNNLLHRLQEKLSNLESEDKILRQRMRAHLSPAPSGKNNLENGHHVIDEHKEPPNKSYGKSDSRLRRSHVEAQPVLSTPETVDALLKCVGQNIGFSEERPVAAITIYKCLLHWRSFEADRTSVFDRLIHMIGSQIPSNTHKKVNISLFLLV
ncbi:uncharacterized protein A4U43_C07F19200 [Asparagus officinalis]|uniref:Myosin motor domain-containing protein n=1 Tax=Asparagus officinalis TaxID=4686 RepID=A0A5P1ED92_ASPOF|nr:uncharacterized protein A4U43_C07F19200 [Asparagus officinalis]